MKKAVIFDLDGLLADSESVSYRLYNGLLEAYGTGFSMETFIENCCGKTMVSNMRSMVKEYDLPISVEECCEWIRSRELDYLEQGVELKKGARNLLVYLKKNSFKILLATSSYKERAVKMLELTGIDVICIPDLKQPSKEYKEKATAVMDSLDEVIGWLDLTNLSK